MPRECHLSSLMGKGSLSWEHCIAKKELLQRFGWEGLLAEHICLPRERPLPSLVGGVVVVVCGNLVFGGIVVLQVVFLDFAF